MKTKSYLSPEMATAFSERGFLQNSSRGTKSNNFFSPHNFFHASSHEYFELWPSSQKCFLGFVGSLLSFLFVFCPLISSFVVVVVNSFLYDCVVFTQL